MSYVTNEAALSAQEKQLFMPRGQSLRRIAANYKRATLFTLTMALLLPAAVQAAGAGVNVAGTVDFAVRAQRSSAAIPAGFHTFFSYRVRVLPLDAAADMSNGIVVGTANGVAVAYVNGQVIPLPGKTGYANIRATAISSNGFIVGSGHSGTNDRGLFWASYNNAPMDMGGLGALTYPRSVNSSGVAVGEFYRTSIDDLPTAFTWSLSGGIRSIAPQSSNQSQAFSISDSGYVAGFAWYGVTQAATRWYPGTFQPGTAAYGNFAWRAMENDTIFGYTTAWDLSNHAYNIAPNAISLVYDMNGNGRKVGTDIFATPRRGWTVAPGGSAAQYLPVPVGAIDSYATRVDRCGTILGSVTYADNTTKAVLWTKMICDELPVFTRAP